MKPIEFTGGMQTVLGEGGIADLPVLTIRYENLGLAIISCWQFSLSDLLRLLLGRLRVYVTVLGERQPAIALATNCREVGIDG